MIMCPALNLRLGHFYLALCESNRLRDFSNVNDQCIDFSEESDVYMCQPPAYCSTRHSVNASSYSNFPSLSHPLKLHVTTSEDGCAPVWEPLS